MHVHFHRFIQDGQTPRVSPWETEIYIDRVGDATPEQLLDVFQAIDELSPLSFHPNSAVNPSTDARDIIATQISQLAELQVGIVRDAERARLEAERRIADRHKEMEAAFIRFREAEEAKISSAREALTTEEANLAERKQKLDDRDHMHVRRGLRGDITKAMQQRMTEPPVSAPTSRLRAAITSYTWAGIIALLGVAAYGAWDTHALASNPATGAWQLGYATSRFVAPLAVATGLLVYLLNWLRRIHAEDVRSARDLERYRFDIDRASWAVETILEAQSESGTRVPSVWIAGATQGLFARSDALDDDSSARDAIAALLGFSAKAKVGTDGLQVELGKGDLKRLSRAE